MGLLGLERGGDINDGTGAERAHNQTHLQTETDTQIGHRVTPQASSHSESENARPLWVSDEFLFLFFFLFCYQTESHITEDG